MNSDERKILNGRRRWFLDDLDQIDESTNRSQPQRTKQSGLTLDREAADHSLSHLSDELVAVAAGRLAVAIERGLHVSYSRFRC